MYGFHKQRNSLFDNCFLHEQFRKGKEYFLFLFKNSNRYQTETLEKKEIYQSRFIEPG